MKEKILNGLKKALPPPRFPQKRYILLGLILYYSLKIYVAMTSDPSDDAWPDQLRGIAHDLMYSEN